MASKESVVEFVDVSPKRLWGAMKDSQNVFPLVMPEFMKSIEPHGDQSAPGATRTIQFGPAAIEKSGGATYMKERLVSLDEANMTVCTEIIEGGALGKKIESAKTQYKVSAGKDANSCETTMEIEYVPIGGASIEGLKIANLQLLKATVAYLHANPTLYA